MNIVEHRCLLVGNSMNLYTSSEESQYAVNNNRIKININIKQEACSSSANRAKPCKFVYALFRDYRHTRASRLLESESVDSSIVIRAT